MFLKEASRAPVQQSQIAWLTRLNGETSTAWRRTVPARPILVESSRGPLLIMAFTNTWSGFWKGDFNNGHSFSKNQEWPNFSYNFKTCIRKFRSMLTSPVNKCMISKECFTIRTVNSFFPLFRPCIIKELTNLK